MAIPDTTSAATFTPPKQRLHHAVSSRAETGQISATDKTALDSAIDTIDASLSSGAGSQPSARLDPSQMKSRIDGLIGNAVANGTLTDDQATTLKGLFSRGTPQDRAADLSRVGGPPPAPPPAGGPLASESNDSASGGAGTQIADATTASTDASSASDLLATFIKQLQSAQGQGSSYGATGAGVGRPAGARVVNFEA